ncbi:IS1380 family transposase [Cryobacterium psychrophilum]|uniref:IS1380 family transposase n=1 Tax=Cryobacterium psychrophilum TaxID=41988 RepID=A0A4Y8KKH2_9MICO|nr:IS1380 family transposase [Cryobacterium psychrophilum]TDW28395.1 DDE family transposase [Cryobacterium psychrophilum]TFD76232.1 IS1380 family transposase [Cryobacterium psychrophilum]
MQVSHTTRAVAHVFDDFNLVSSAGLVPAMKLAEKAGLRRLADKWLSVPTDKGANAGLKIVSLVAGMVAGADSIDDMAVLRHGGMRKLFAHLYAPSTLGSFLRAFTFGHVRQLDAIASRFLIRLAALSPLILLEPDGDYVFLDVDDTIIEVHGHQKQGASFGYSGVRGLNAILATVKTVTGAPIILAQRLRRGAASSPHGATRLIRDALATLRRLPGMGTARVLFRADSAFYTFAAIHAVLAGGAAVSVTARLDSAVRKAIAAIPATGWTPIKYTHAIYDEGTRTWISDAEVAEITYTAFTSRKKADHIPGRLVVRRIPELNKQKLAGQSTLFTLHRFHAFFTTSTLDTVTADTTHRAHAAIELVNSDLKSSALAHLPSGVFAANAAWLVLAVIAFNLTRAATVTAGTGLARATTATIRRKLINIPARIASSARQITLHLPENWPWETGWTHLFDHAFAPPSPTPT